MSFKVGDKVKMRDSNTYEYMHPSVADFIRHGSVAKHSYKYGKRGAKVIKVVDNYCVVRYLDTEMNYVDLAYRHNNLVPHEDQKPNVIPLKSFGDLGKSLMNDIGNTNLVNARELYFDNFNLKYFIGEYKGDIYFIKVRDGILSHDDIDNIFKVVPNGDIKIVDEKKFKSMTWDYKNIKINHRPLKLKLV